MSLGKEISFRSIPHFSQESLNEDGSVEVKQVPFKRRDYYLRQEYLRLFDDRIQKIALKDWNRALDFKVGGYQMPFNNNSSKHSSTAAWLFSFIMTGLWWLILSTVGLLIGLSALVMCLRNPQAKMPKRVVNDAQLFTNKNVNEDEWVEAFDVKEGRTFYYNQATGDSEWKEDNVHVQSDDESYYPPLKGLRLRAHRVPQFDS